MTMETQQRSQWVAFAWKIPLIAAIYFAGTMIAGRLTSGLGLQLPEFPGQEYRPTLTFLATLALAGGVALLARGLRGSQAARWLILATFTYVAFCVNNQIEGAVFTTASGFGANLLFFLIPCALITLAAVLLIRAPEEDAVLVTVFKDRPVSAWWWRAALAWVAFPFIYYFFGAFAYPLVKDAYQSGDFALEVPSQSLILGAVFTRSLLFLLATIPIFFYWTRSRRSLVLSLGAALAAMVGVTAMIEAAWLPATVRIVHGVEITVDSLAHAWAMVALLAPRRHPRSDETTAAPVDAASVE
jgi:hypothetical protein